MSAVVERTPRKWKDALRLVAVVLVAALLAGAGYWFLSRSSKVDGNVLYHGEDTSSVRLGPGGWFVRSGEGAGVLVEHAPSGRSWQAESFLSADALTSDGQMVSVSGSDIIVSGEGTQVEAKAADLLVAHGDKSLRTGGAAEVIGLSARHVVVASCLSADGEATPGSGTQGTLVVSGVRLDDGTVTWSHDPEVDCDTDLTTLHPLSLPEQQYALLTPSEEQTVALDLDSGKVAQTWQDSPRGRVVVRGDVALRRLGDEVSAISLRSGARIAQVSCPGAGLDNPGESGGRLAPSATPAVACGESTRLFDGKDFVTVDAPAVGESQQVEDGKRAVLDRYLLARDGGRVTITDALSDKEIGVVDVPDGFRIATNEPRGRLISFFTSDEKFFGDQLISQFRIVDAQTGTLVASTGKDLAPGAVVSPDGYAVLSRRTEGRARRPATEDVWVVGVR